MKSFQWNEYFETGIEDVDSQHLILVELLNECGALVAENNVTVEALNQAIKKLSDYTIYHFKEEETLMRSVGIDNQHFIAHRFLHKKFIQDIHDFSKVVLVEGTEERFVRQLFEYLVQWLVYHILGSDQNMARQLEAIRNGEHPQQVYEREEREHKESVGPLLHALQTMFEQVSDRNKELMLLNQSLEEKVEERTRQLMAANKKLELLSYTDTLTRLPNRRYGLNKLDKEWETSVSDDKPLLCMLIDIDNFKLVNDNGGHAMGDEVLADVAEKLSQNLRKEDTICRLGGDEFLAICPGLTFEDAMNLASRILVHIRAIRKQCGEYCWTGSLSIGVAERNEGMNHSRELIKEADKAVYKAKNSGRNQVCHLLDKVTVS
ncbi:GGDEF domain-containing protein [Vibrio albus]|uniref:diguanylate cyclase n=1 Tax=Vibrio albus TaxID=2200953 RepID=A0A2U3BBN1_9VIBR|nr:GGDEF domain-containing protein [Vibrio albus]